MNSRNIPSTIMHIRILTLASLTRRRKTRTSHLVCRSSLAMVGFQMYCNNQINHLPAFSFPFLESTPSNIPSISLLISLRLTFRLLTSSNFLWVVASSMNDSKRASCSSSGCKVRARSESGSISGSSTRLSRIPESDVEQRPDSLRLLYDGPDKD